jgi:hypothetical protein
MALGASRTLLGFKLAPLHELIVPFCSTTSRAKPIVLDLNLCSHIATNSNQTEVNEQACDQCAASASPELTWSLLTFACVHAIADVEYFRTPRFGRQGLGGQKPDGVVVLRRTLPQDSALRTTPSSLWPPLTPWG